VVATPAAPTVLACWAGGDEVLADGVVEEHGENTQRVVVTVAAA
jgi:hypothetical protein